jgi:RHS repeat-associated protein
MRLRLTATAGAIVLAALASLTPGLAQTSTDFFLHGIGPENNPPTLVLDTTAPTASTAKFRDSTSVNFSGGNPWKDIGTWPAQAALTSGTLTALSDLHVWLGLKNSDDQGTQFDLQAEVLKNGTVIATGLTRCITGIVRNAANAKEAIVAFGSVPATPFNGTSDALSIRISTRIGTNPDETKCPGHNNAAGLRLYFDATSRSARFDATIATQQTPTITSFTPAEGPVGTSVTITGTNFDPVPANNTVTFNGVTATVTAATATSLTATVPTGATTGPITVTTAAGTATSATNFTVLVPPSVTGFTPASGRTGNSVTVIGTNFVNVSAVTFNGIAATSFTVQTATTLTAVVPPTATTGPLAVTTSGGTGTSPGHFVVIPTQDLQLSVLPATLTIPSIGQTSFNVALTGSSFTNLASLNITGVPTGMTASFTTTTLTVGQSTLLTLTTTGTVPATGFVNGTQTTRSSNVTVQVLAAGVTTLTGLVLDEADQPVKGARVTLGPLTAPAAQILTDDGGNFLMQNPAAGTDQPFFIDGGPASTPTKSLPIIPYKVTIAAGQTNQLSFVPHLHVQKTTGLVDISNSAVERIVTDPDLPGFQMTIPAGATITGWDGQPNTQVSVRRVPIDRMPLPPAPLGFVGGALYIDYFGKPGGGTPSEPIPITLPNDLDLPPGTQVELWYFDEAPDGSRPNQWAQYGTGTVSSDGSQIVPDLDPATGKPYGQPRFCCGANLALIRRAIFDSIFNRPPLGPDTSQGGDPVDLATGLFTLQKTDLVLPGRMPIVWTRTFRNQGSPTGPFGRGTAHAYQVLVGRQANQRILLLPDGRRFVLTLQSDSTYRNLTDRALQGAVLTEPSGVSTLRWNDGTTWTFGAASGLAENTFELTQLADRNGNTTTLTRSGNQITAIIGPDGRALTLEYDGGNRITRLSDPIGRIVAYAYDNQGNLATVTDPEQGVTRYSYDSANRLTTITDPKGLTYLQNVYGPSGRVLRQIQADGGEWRFRYDLTGAAVTGPCTPLTGNSVTIALPFTACPTVDSWENLQAGFTITGGTVTAATAVDPRGQLATTRFTQRGYEAGRTDALGQTASSQRTTANQVAGTTDSLGRTTTFEYDANGNVITITDPINQVTRFEYETTFNRVKKITDALNQVTEFTYDPANGNLLTVKDPLNHTTTIGYNAFGQPLTVADPLNHTTTFAYDTNGNLITTTDPLSNQTQRAYDTVSRLVNLTDPRQLQTQFRYDGLNRVTEIADARQGITRFNYDFNGNLLEVKDAKAQPTNYTYDSMDRLRTRKDALNRQESYQYDPAGNLTHFTDRKTQPAIFTYDALNRRTRADYADGSFTTFTYDAVGRLTRATDSTPGSIDFFYDNLDRLILEATSQGAVSYEYDAIGRRAKMTVAGQAPVTYQYDAASRLTQVAQGSLIVGIGYDAAGRRTSLTYPNSTSTAYTYDNASRLTRILHQGPGATTIEELTYTYDAAGNRTSLTRANGTASLLPNAVASASYDAANEQISFAGATLTYDQNGNLTNDGTNTYTWDARNRLTGISGGVTASFQYDPLGRRTSKTIGGITTQFLYDGNDIVQELQNGAPVASYLRSLNIDEPFGILRQDGVYFYIHDGLGSALALTNQAGNSAVQYSYEPFGKPQSSIPAFKNPFQFTARESDQTSLSYNRARYYSFDKSRFISQDLLGFPANDFDPTLYVYVTNNPVNFVDPYGLAKNKKGQLGQQGGSGALRSDDPIVQQGKEIAQKEGPRKGARYIDEQIRKGVDPNGNVLSKDRKAHLRAAAKLLKEAARRGLQIGGAAIGIVLFLLDPAEAYAPADEQDIQKSKSQEEQ